MIQVYTANVGPVDPIDAMPDCHAFFDDILDNRILSARLYKCIPHILFPNAEWTIWIDANVTLHKPPETFVEMCSSCGDGTFGVFSHYHRKTIFEEIIEESRSPFDKPERVAKTANRVNQHKPLAQNMVLVRKNTLVNAERNLRWWTEICLGSWRDQLSFSEFFPGPYWPTVDFTQPNEFFTRVSEL
jgi:hypothetical protein